MEKELKLKYGKALKSIMHELQVNQKEFANLCGISQPYLSQIFSGDRIPDLIMLERICKRLEVPLPIFIFKAINEESISDPRKAKLIREIKPIFKKIASSLYFSANMQLEKELI